MYGIGEVWLDPDGVAQTVDGGSDVHVRFVGLGAWTLPLEGWEKVDFSGTWRDKADGRECVVDREANKESRDDAYPLTIVYTSEGCGYACNASLFYQRRVKI